MFRRLFVKPEISVECSGVGCGPSQDDVSREEGTQHQRKRLGTYIYTHTLSATLRGFPSFLGVFVKLGELRE